MTFYTYFKDYNGDKQAGKKTIIVIFGLEKSKVIALISAFIPIIVFIFLQSIKILFFDLNTTFIILGIDSFGYLMIVNALEDEFNIHIDETEFQYLRTVSEIIDELLSRYPGI
ncbi:MAG: hypothetical protein JXJ04_03540 [Spirochaetales bacterium]|nr:hypothetical protein [Spirochaetales bacterium]